MIFTTASEHNGSEFSETTNELVRVEYGKVSRHGDCRSKKEKWCDTVNSESVILGSDFFYLN